MEHKSNQMWKKGVSLLLVLCMVWYSFGHYFPTGVVKAAEPVKYTVELNNAGNVFLCNATPTDGPVTITYTVESGSVSEDYLQGGVIATTDPQAAYPYDQGKGSMRFHHVDCWLLNEGYTHVAEIGKDAAGNVTSTITVQGYWDPFSFSSYQSAGTATPDAKYFGIWVAGGTGTAKLTNVTCVDADGNDLGLQTNNSEECKITGGGAGEPPTEPTEYTVKLDNAEYVFLCNNTPTDGPVTITYTAEPGSVNEDYLQGGVIATTEPQEKYPYDQGKGSMRFHHLDCWLLNEGYTHVVEIGKDAAGNVTSTLTVQGLWAPFSFSSYQSAGTATPDAKYFGIWVAGGTGTAKLTNVTCVDKDGNDLGLRTNSENCIITGGESGGEPGGDEPENVPADDRNAVKNVVDINGKENFFFSNEKAATGPITLRYTVASATAESVGNNGVVATTDPTDAYPYQYGSMKFHHLQNVVMVEGRSYTFVINMDENGKVTYVGSYTDEENTTPVSLEEMLPNPAGNGSKGSHYFGIYFAPTTTAKLTDVTCVDKDGNDLGIRTNQKKEMPAGDDSKAVKYTVRTGAEYNSFISNKKASSGPVTLRYTVESVSAEEVGNNGVVATTDPTGSYPYTSGSMLFWHAGNIMMVEGRTYTVIMELDAEGKITYGGSYTDGENPTPVSLDGLLPNPTDGSSKESRYFGIYFAPAAEIKLTNVTCVDADGNDLGVQLNLDNCIITAGEDGKQEKPETLDSSYSMITLGNFGIQDGTYRSVIEKGSYALSMHKKVFTVDIEFSPDLGEDFRYGSQTDGWHGLRFWSDGSSLHMEDVDGYTDTYTFVPIKAGTTLVGETFNLKLSTEYVDSDKDGAKDDVKLGVWFNDKLYDNKYIYLKDYKDVLGKYIGVYCSNDIAYIKVKGVTGIETGIDYSIFGYTRNWQKELGIK